MNNVMDFYHHLEMFEEEYPIKNYPIVLIKYVILHHLRMLSNAQSIV